MPKNAKSSGANRKPNELYIYRVYDAPVKMVWDAWADPAQAAKWWGPRGFTLTTHSKDLRAGGTWRYTMHGPDGTDYPNVTKYYEVEECARLVYDHGGTDDRPPLFRVTVTFEEVEGKTHLEMVMTLATAEAAAEIKKFIKKAGGESTWDRLAEYLADEEGHDHFVINRSFEASRETVFRLWMDPEHLARWLPPAGFTMKYSRAEIREGGESLWSMTNGKGTTMHGSIHYLEIRPPERLVYTQQFRDEKGGISRHPMAPVWPETMLTAVVFEEEGPGRTRVTVTWQPHGPATKEEREAFRGARSGMTMGWTGSFDKLEELMSEKR